MALIKGTTPTIIFTFNEVHISDIQKAYLVVKQQNVTVIEKDIASATVTEEDIRWKLEQSETLALKEGVRADIYCDWLLNDGTRGRSNMKNENVEVSGKNEVI